MLEKLCNIITNHHQFECNSCHRTFTSKQALNSHRGLSKFCKQNMKYKCLFCDYYEQNRDYVQKHMSFKHKSDMQKRRNDGLTNFPLELENLL